MIFADPAKAEYYPEPIYRLGVPYVFVVYRTTMEGCSKMNVGLIDGEALIQMNNLSIGYFPATVNAAPLSYPVQTPTPGVIPASPLCPSGRTEECSGIQNRCVTL
jgi:hypothetical protein